MSKPENTNRSVDEVEEDSFLNDDSQDVPPPDIVSYNELRSCADLFRMHEQRILDIQPAFQRDVVWNGPSQTRFIDSLLKQLPIPSMCFALDAKQQRWIVIDGLQRMATMVRFLKGSDWKLSKLGDIDPILGGVSAATFKNSEGKAGDVYKRIENLTVPITVLRCDFKKEQHMEYLFTIFHRLNSGGDKLSNQEIRNGIYGGNFNELLKSLDKNTKWRRANKLQQQGSYRYKYQEVILRFFALTEDFQSYDGQLAKFLNSFMHRNRSADETKLHARQDLFERTVELFYSKALRGKSPTKKIPVTVLESVLVGIANNLEHLNTCTDAAVEKKFKKLIEHPHFSEEARKEGLSKREKVRARINTAVEIFSE